MAIVRRPRQGGFTLIELLVVLVIIGALVSLALFSTGRDNERELREEAQRLATLLSLLADEAVLESRDYGLLLSSSGYQVLEFSEDCGCWLTSGNQQSYRLPDWMRLQLKLDGEPLQLVEMASDNLESQEGEEDQSRAGAKGLEPQLLLLSSGELSAFRLRLESRDRPQRAFTVSSDGYQLLAVTRMVD